MTKLEQQRLEDFKKVLTYHLISKIQHHFNGNYKAYYQATTIWQKWKDRQWNYANANPYAIIAKFNDTSLSREQVQHIFGFDSEHKCIKYKALIEQDTELTVHNKGTLVVKGRRFGIKQRYQLPFNYIEQIFKDTVLLSSVLDASSDFYSDRQRRLIFTQINKLKNYHYKTNKQIEQDKTADEQISEMEADGLFDGI